MYIWQSLDWPQWRYDLAAIAEPMAEVSRAQGYEATCSGGPGGRTDATGNQRSQPAASRM